MVGVLLLGILFFMGDPSAPTPTGFLHRLLFQKAPKLLASAIERLPFGRAIVRLVTRAVHYTLFEPNPFLQVFYLVLIGGGYVVFVFVGMPYIPGPFLGWGHRYVAPVAVGLTLGTFLIASYKKPGRISAATVRRFDNYDYDGLLYVHRECSTCKTPKLARSKHCRMLGYCVPRYDHWCPWICTTVGEENYRWFLLFIFSNVLLLMYTAWGIASILLGIVVSERLFEATFVHRDTGERIPCKRIHGPHVPASPS